jgi:hypothetical protein
LQCSGGQGVCREAESKGHAENYRAVVDGGEPERAFEKYASAQICPN